MCVHIILCYSFTDSMKKSETSTGWVGQTIHFFCIKLCCLRKMLEMNGLILAKDLKPLFDSKKSPSRTWVLAGISLGSRPKVYWIEHAKWLRLMIWLQLLKDISSCLVRFLISEGLYWSTQLHQGNRILFLSVIIFLFFISTRWRARVLRRSIVFECLHWCYLHVNVGIVFF